MANSKKDIQYPGPDQTALWLARVSIGLLLGGALWLMGVRVTRHTPDYSIQPVPPRGADTGSALR
jgi:hypothetical protein